MSWDFPELIMALTFALMNRQLYVITIAGYITSYSKIAGMYGDLPAKRRTYV